MLVVIVLDIVLYIMVEGHKGGHSGDGHIEEDTEYSVHCDCNNVFNSVCGGDNKTYSCASQEKLLLFKLYNLPF